MAQGEWKTINGAHVFIEGGQSVEDAFDKRGTGAKSGSIIVGKGERADNLPNNLPSTRRTVNPGKESKSSKAYGNRIKQQFNITEVNISRTDPKCAKIAYDNFSECFKLFPKMRGYIKKFVYKADLGEIAQWSFADKTIYVGSAFTSLEHLQASYMSQVQTGVFYKKTSYLGVIAHEFGHALSHYIGSKDDICNIITDQIYKEFNLTEDFVDSHISSYAAKNKREFFAFYFQEYMERGEKSSKIAKRVIQLFEEDLKNVTNARYATK